MAHVKGHEDIYKGRKIPPRKKETTKDKILRVLKETSGTFSGADTSSAKHRQAQFTGYMNLIDSLKRTRVNLPGRIALGNLTAASGKIYDPKVTKMATIMNQYHDKALRMAQAKYYQKQLG